MGVLRRVPDDLVLCETAVPFAPRRSSEARLQAKGLIRPFSQNTLDHRCPETTPGRDFLLLKSQKVHAA